MQVPDHAEPPVVREVRSVFFDTPEQVYPLTLRTLAIGVAVAAVSASVYRFVPQVDGLPYERRDQLLMAEQFELAQELMPALWPDLQPDFAREILHSSVDQYGRATKDSAMLVGYLLQKEWELARVSGTLVDQYGYRYETTPEQFVSRVSPVIAMQVSMEYFRLLCQYEQIVMETNGQVLTQPPPADRLPRWRIDLLTTEDLKQASAQGILAPEELDALSARITAEHQHALAHQQAEQRKQQTMAALGVAGAVAVAFMNRPRKPKTPSTSLKEIAEMRAVEKRDRENNEIHKVALKRAREYEWNHQWDLF